MIRDPRFRTSDDDLAVRLSRYWDALVDDAVTPESAADLGDLAVIVHGLAELPRDPAPEDVHARARARLGANSEWLALLTTRSHDVASIPLVPNGHPRIDDAVDTGIVDRPPTPLRRILPLVELAAIAAVLAVLLYVAFDRYQTADESTPTAVPTPAVTPTTPVQTPTPAPGAVGDWPMLGGGPNRSGGADRAIPAAEPMVKWTAKLPAGIRYPVAAGDAVYVSNGGVVVALDAATGAERWRFDLGIPPSVTGANAPAVVGGVVYVGARDGTVFALDATTGQQVWMYETNGTISTGLAVAGGAVYAGTNEGDLVALDATTGDRRWLYPAGSISISSPVVADGAVYVGSGGDELHAVDAATGIARWKVTVKPGMQSVAVGDGIAVAAGINTGSATLLIAVDAASGKTRWQSPRGTELPPAIVGGTVYVTDLTRIYALGSERPTQRWAYEARLKIVDATLAGDALLLCRRDAVVIALDAATGKERWRIATSGMATGIAVGAKVLYVAHDDGTIAAYG